MLLDRLHPSNLSVLLDKLRFHAARRMGLLELVCAEHDMFLKYKAASAPASRSQVGQDLFVLHSLDGKRNGYFVDFGATDGVTLSNSHLLETEYGWRGVCAEPSRRWQSALRANRRCIIEERCLWSRSGDRLRFTECNEGEYSTLTKFVESDGHAGLRKQSMQSEYEVETVSLTDMLSSHCAPSMIDYLSIDTEGSEHQILAAHDFQRYRFRIITVEHNGVYHRRNQIASLLGRNGYRRAIPAISAFDDWYVLRADW